MQNPFFPRLKCQYLTFWENQSGGRPGSAKGLIALLTETLQERNGKSPTTYFLPQPTCREKKLTCLDVHHWIAPINRTKLSVSCYVWALLKYSPWTQKYLPTPKQQLPSLALKSKFLASHDTITFPQKLWWGGKKAAKQSCKCRSNTQESITKYPPWPQLTSSDLCWNNATLCSD